MILIWRFGNCVNITKLTHAIIDPFILQTWVSVHTVLKADKLKSHQQRFWANHQILCLLFLVCVCLSVCLCVLVYVCTCTCMYTVCFVHVSVCVCLCVHVQWHIIITKVYKTYNILFHCDKFAPWTFAFAQLMTETALHQTEKDDHCF